MMGIRGVQIEPRNLELDKLENPTSAALSTLSDVDLTSTGTIALYVATQKTYVLGVLIRITAANTATVDAEVSVGVNPNTSDVFSNETLIDLNAINDLYTFWDNKNTGIILNTSDQLDLSINTAAIANSLISTVYVIGIQL